MAEASGAADIEQAKGRSLDPSEVAQLAKEEVVGEVKVEASKKQGETVLKEESDVASIAEDQDSVDRNVQVAAEEGISSSEEKEISGGDAHLQATQTPQATLSEAEVCLADADQKSQEAGCTEDHHHTEDMKLTDTATEMHPKVSSKETDQGLREESDSESKANHNDDRSQADQGPVLDDPCRGEMEFCDANMVDAAHASADPEPVDAVAAVHTPSLGSKSLNLEKDAGQEATALGSAFAGEDFGGQKDHVAEEPPPSDSIVEVQRQDIVKQSEDSNEPVMDDSHGRHHKASIRNIEEGDVVLDTVPVDDSLGHQEDCGVVDTNLADTVPEVPPQVTGGETDVGRGSVINHDEDEEASNPKTHSVVTKKSNEEGDSSFDSIPVGDAIDANLDDPTVEALDKVRGVVADVDDELIVKVDEVKDGVQGVPGVSSLQISSVEASQDLQEDDNELKPNHIDRYIDPRVDIAKESIIADPEVEVQTQVTGRETEVADVGSLDVDQDSTCKASVSQNSLVDTERNTQEGGGIMLEQDSFDDTIGHLAGHVTAGPNQADPVVVVQSQVICDGSEVSNESMMNLPKDTATVGGIINRQADCVSEHANLDDLALKSRSRIRSIETDGYEGFMMKGDEGKDHEVSGWHTSLTETNHNSLVERETLLDSIPVEADYFTKDPDQADQVMGPDVSAGSDVDGDEERDSEASACKSSLVETNQQIQEEGNTLLDPVTVDEAADYQASRDAEDKYLITKGSIITTTLDGLMTPVAKAENGDANPVIADPLGIGYSLIPGMQLAQNFADLSAASSESLPVRVSAMTDGNITKVGFGYVADSNYAEDQEAFVPKMHLADNTHEDENLLDSFSVGDNINQQDDRASQDRDPVDPSIELKSKIENIEADGSDWFVMEGDESKDHEASILHTSLTATTQNIQEESGTVLDSVPLEADHYTNDTNQVNPSMEVKSEIVSTEIEVSDVPERDADQDTYREASTLKTSLVEIQGEEPENCGGSFGEKLMVAGDILENSSSVVETNTQRAPELSEILTVLSQGKGYVDLLQDADPDREMQSVCTSVDGSICANAYKLDSSLGKSQIIVTDSVINKDMPQASACKRVESIQESVAKQEIQAPNNKRNVLIDEGANGKQNVNVGNGELLKGTERQAVQCLGTSIGGIPVMENKQHISYNLPFVDTANFSISDLVWGKVKSHPWWPGQIFNPSDASQLALKYQKKNNYLVAYFGDKTFAWCDDSQLKPFYSYFSQMEKQCSSDTFATAMNDIVVEISRRVELGMACSCFPDEAYANIKFQKVDNAGVRKGNITSILDRPQVLNYFQPGELLEYIKTLAQFPNGGVDRLELVIAKSQLKAFYCSKGYPELPTFTVHRGLIEDVAPEIPLSNVKRVDNTEHSTPDIPELGSGKGKLSSSNNSFKKRKHVLEDDAKQKGMSGLTNEENGLHLGDGGKSKSGLEASEIFISSSSGMKHTVLGSDSTNSGRHKKRTPDFFREIEPTSSSPTVTSSFKIGEFIRRAASQLTGAAPVVKCQQESSPKNAPQTDCRKGIVTDFDVLPHAPEENKETETSLSENNSSPDEMLWQLCLAARDPMSGDSFVSMMVDFFTSFRNSCVSCIHEGNKHVEKRKRGRPRKVIPRPLFSELFSDISSSEEKPVEKQKRCRPKKYSETAISNIGSSEEKQHVGKCSSENHHVEKRRRGRPKKVIPQPAISDTSSLEEKHADKRKRGRPRKVTSQLATSDMSTPDHMEDSYWSDTNLEKRPRKKSLYGLKRKGESCAQIRQKRKSAGDEPLSLPSVSMLENEQKLQSVAMNTNIKYSSIAERPIISVVEKIVDERMPTALILSFSSSDTLPSPTDLIRIFSRYGPLKEAETDVVIKTNRAKVVFKRHVDAEAAFSSAGKYSIFGPGLLSYQLKYLPLTTKPAQQTTQVQHDAASAAKPEEDHDTASIVIPQNLNPTIATLQGDHDQAISVAQNEHDEDPMTTPQDMHDTIASTSKPQENHDTASFVVPPDNLDPTIVTLRGDHDQVMSVAPNEHDEEPMITPQDKNDKILVSRPQTDESGSIPTPHEKKDAGLMQECNLKTSEVAGGGIALDTILVEAEAKLSLQGKYDATSITKPEEYHDAASIPTQERKKDAGLMQGCNSEIPELAEGGIALGTMLVEAGAELPQGKYYAASIPQPREYHDPASIAAPKDKLDSTTFTTSGDYHDATPITSTQDQYEATQIESSSSLPEDITTEHLDYHDAAPVAASPDYHDATPNAASQEYQDATPNTALQENYEETQEQSETVMKVDNLQVDAKE